MLPPPAPTVTMSIIGILTGKRPTAPSVVRPGAPCSTRQTSVVVPPPSAREHPVEAGGPGDQAGAERAGRRAGQDRRDRLVRDLARREHAAVRLHHVERHTAARARCRGAPGWRRRRRTTRDFTDASTSVVMVRSYSRYSGSTSEEIDTCAAGMLALEDLAHPLLVRGIGVGVQEAHADGVDAAVPEPARHLRGLRLVERAQHLAPKVRAARAPRAPGAAARCARASPRSRSCRSRRGTACRAISRMCRKPSVVMKPSPGNRSSSSALVATVVPWETEATPVETPPSSARTRPVASAAPCGCRRARRPTGRAGVDGVLVVTISPVASSTATTSVNVPPVSMPMRRRRLTRLVPLSARVYEEGDRRSNARKDNDAWPEDPTGGA